MHLSGMTEFPKLKLYKEEKIVSLKHSMNFVEKNILIPVTLWRIEDTTEMVVRRKKRRFGGRKQNK